MAGNSGYDDDDDILPRLLQLQNPGTNCAIASFICGIITLIAYSNLRQTLGTRFKHISYLIITETSHNFLLILSPFVNETATGIIYCIGNTLTILTFMLAVVIVYDLRLVILKQHWTKGGIKRLSFLLCCIASIDLIYSNSIYFSNLEVRKDVHSNLLYASLFNIFVLFVSYLWVIVLVLSIRGRIYHEKTGVEYIDRKYARHARRMNTALLFPLSLLLTSGLRLIVLIIAFSNGQTVPELAESPNKSLQRISAVYQVSYGLFASEGMIMTFIFFSFISVQHKISKSYHYFQVLPSHKEKACFLLERLACGYFGYSHQTHKFTHEITDKVSHHNHEDIEGQLEEDYGGGLKASQNHRLDQKKAKRKRRNSSSLDTGVELSSVLRSSSRANNGPLPIENPVLETQTETGKASGHSSKLFSIDLQSDTSEIEPDDLDPDLHRNVPNNQTQINGVEDEREEMTEEELEIQELNEEEEFHFGYREMPKHLIARGSVSI